MESEHREIGLGDPGLGRQVRKLVGSLSRRVDLWRETIAQDRPWEQATKDSMYGGEMSADALAHCTRSLKDFWKALGAKSAGDLAQGRIG
jgi:cytochrome b pre-mRNA-processing protein 3